MANISGGSVVWNLDIDDSKFKSKLRNASTEMQDGANRAEKASSKSWLKMGAVIGAVAGAAQAVFSKAMNVIGNSVTDAVKRVDILNNFPKIMSNMGVSADESKKVIKELSTSLQGLPTPLDSAALAVQRLTASTGNVGRAKDVFLALNNAILAGGAPMQLQSSAMEQFSQSFAKGKPDMMEWRSLMTAMPAQLMQLAKAMGLPDADALGEGLRDGSISMETFSNALVDLNKNGTGQFQSFEKQARNSTGGIATGFANMNTAIARGMANIMEVIGQGNISNAISNVGKAFETASKSIATGLSFLIDNKDLVIAGFIGIAGAITIAFMPAIAGAAASLVALIPALVASAVAMAPFILAGIAIAGVALLVKKNWEPISETFKKFWNVIKPLRDFIGDQLISAFASLKSIWGEITKSMQPMIDAFKVFWSKHGAQVVKVMKVLGIIMAAIVLAPLVQGFLLMVGALKVLAIVLGFVARHFDAVKKVILVGLAVVFWPLISAIVVIVATVKTLIAIFNVMKTVIGAVIGVVATVFSAIYNVIKPVLEFIMNLYIIVWGSILLATVSTLKKIWNVISSVFNAIVAFVSPILSWLISFWSSIFTRILNHTKAIWSTIFSVISGIVNAIIGFFAPAANWLYQRGADIVRGLVNGIKAVIGAVSGAARSAANAATGIFGAAGRWLYNSGRAIFQGLIDGMSSIAGRVAGKAKEIMQSVRNLLPFSPAKEGPFSGKGWTLYSGRSLVKGFAKGITDMKGLPNKAFESIASGLSADVTQDIGYRATQVPYADIEGTIGTTNNQTVTIGSITLGDESAVIEFFDKLNQDTVNLGMGLTPRQGL